MDPEPLLLAMFDHPHRAGEIAAAYERGELDDLLAGKPAPTDDEPTPDE